MTDPYRKHEEPSTEQLEAEPIAPAEELGTRISSHARTGPSGAVGSVLGSESAVDMHANGLVVRGLLGTRTEILFSEIDAVHHLFEENEDGAPSVALTTFEGVRVEIPSSVRGIDRIIADIDREVTQPLIEPAKEALARGERLLFGPLTLELDGIVLHGRSLPWSMLPKVIARRHALMFHAPDTYGRFGVLPLRDVPHPRVLLAVLRMRTRVIRQGLRLFGEHDE